MVKSERRVRITIEVSGKQSPVCTLRERLRMIYLVWKLSSRKRLQKQRSDTTACWEVSSDLATTWWMETDGLWPISTVGYVKTIKLLQ